MKFFSTLVIFYHKISLRLLSDIIPKINKKTFRDFGCSHSSIVRLVTHNEVFERFYTSYIDYLSQVWRNVVKHLVLYSLQIRNNIPICNLAPQTLFRQYVSPVYHSNVISLMIFLLLLASQFSQREYIFRFEKYKGSDLFRYFFFFRITYQFVDFVPYLLLLILVYYEPCQHKIRIMVSFCFNHLSTI